MFLTCYSKITQGNTDWRVLEKDSLEVRDVHCNMNFCIASPWGKCINFCRFAKIKKKPISSQANLKQPTVLGSVYFPLDLLEKDPCTLGKSLLLQSRQFGCVFRILSKMDAHCNS